MDTLSPFPAPIKGADVARVNRCKKTTGDIVHETSKYVIPGD
jgi:hypothetical protein